VLYRNFLFKNPKLLLYRYVGGIRETVCVSVKQWEKEENEVREEGEEGEEDEGNVREVKKKKKEKNSP
jgi:hypothetical protein